jgi:hypothetical protein
MTYPEEWTVVNRTGVEPIRIRDCDTWKYKLETIATMAKMRFMNVKQFWIPEEIWDELWAEFESTKVVNDNVSVSLGNTIEMMKGCQGSWIRIRVEVNVPVVIDYDCVVLD